MDLSTTSRKEWYHVSGNGIMSPGLLSAGYDMSYTYGTEPGRHFQMDRVTETHYRTEVTPAAADSIHSTHSYSYDPNGNLAYESVARKRLDGGATPKISERKLLWDARNRLRALSDDVYVSLYWYDADGNRTVKERHGGEAVWVNSARAGQRTDSVIYSIYPGRTSTSTVTTGRSTTTLARSVWHRVPARSVGDSARWTSRATSWPPPAHGVYIQNGRKYVR